MVGRRALNAQTAGSIPRRGAIDGGQVGYVPACKAEPSGFDPHSVVHASLAQWTRAAGFYPAGRGFESYVKRQFALLDQLEDRPNPSREVVGSSPAESATES